MLMFNGRAVKIRTLFSLLPLSALLACGTLNSIGNSKNSAAEAKIRQLERELKKRQVALDELKERNLVLESRLGALKKADGSSRDVTREIGPNASPVQTVQPPQQSQTAPQLQQAQPPTTLPPRVTPVASAASASAVKVKTVTETAVAAVKDDGTQQPQEILQTGEQRLYSKVLESYRVHNKDELQKAVQILLKTYPDSIYADNGLYLAGLLAFESNDLVRSSAFMDRVIREYPKGNKTVSALFAKAMIFKRGRNFKEAKTLLELIRKNYPGSPEALRVGIEEKLIEMAAVPGKKGEG